MSNTSGGYSRKVWQKGVHRSVHPFCHNLRNCVSSALTPYPSLPASPGRLPTDKRPFLAAISARTSARGERSNCSPLSMFYFIFCPVLPTCPLPTSRRPRTTPPPSPTNIPRLLYPVGSVSGRRPLPRPPPPPLSPPSPSPTATFAPTSKLNAPLQKRVFLGPLDGRNMTPEALSNALASFRCYDLF
ncbi:hypothetical protein GLOTRDRAFT_134352 [Gloeophyllum trabeum ATCC 11539]|uniref:Uncharacterized protein n=1 Tax=Gloeophyllum trabeum (strain ATCC 11539 / FP-39264 / Madison 617) TaxID=670483 RepID=S7PQC8_GLOTA|nr:uncharacterized protein GLOTRDRAFT_134352 [Gloeophyllum trabeum ATCC 11539]EPQ50006.1 hypothetical protein GLOTRDRAFT_134352 [Gloeophyllum trabeum ATCC 11539]